MRGHWPPNLFLSHPIDLLKEPKALRISIPVFYPRMLNKHVAHASRREFLSHSQTLAKNHIIRGIQFIREPDSSSHSRERLAGFLQITNRGLSKWA